MEIGKRNPENMEGLKRDAEEALDKVPSNPLLDAFRKQCQTMKDKGNSPYLVLLMWKDQEGVDPDDLINITQEVEGG